MRIEEIPVEANVLLDIFFDENHLKHDAVVLQTDPEKQYALITAILRNGKPVSLKESHVTVNMTVTLKDSKPILFPSVNITSVSVPDIGICYKVTSKVPGKEINRRRNFRCYMGYDVPIKVNNRVANSQALLKDISISGFGFIHETDYKVGDIVHLSVNDLLEEYETRYAFVLTGKIVRKEEFQEGRHIYGCMIMALPKDLNKYITEKERIRIRKSRQ